MDNNYKVMTYAEMAEFIRNMNLNEVYSFSPYYEEKDNGQYSYGIWYGLVKQRLFDTIIITLGIFGGGDVSSFELIKYETDKEVEEKFFNYIQNHATDYVDGDTSVLLDIIPVN